MFFIKILIMFLLIYMPDYALSQSYPIYKKTSVIAVLDQDALFTQSVWGKRIIIEVENRVKILSAENRSIEKKLEYEELELTEKRKLINKLEFNTLAIKFDTKVKKIREDQANKQREINLYLNENRALFFKDITPILLSFIDELGVEVVLNKDTIALASTGSDITEMTINRINEKLK